MFIPNYKLSNSTIEDIIRIHHIGVNRFRTRQADKYFNELFTYFNRIANNPYSFEAADHIRDGYRRCPCGSDTIYYRLINDDVEIMAIIGKQDFNKEL